MRISIAILFLMTAGCYGPWNPVNKTNGTKKSSVVKACTEIASFTMVRLHLTVDSPLPNNIRAVLNNGTVVADECVAFKNYETAIQVSSDRMKADIYFYLDGTSEYANYFNQAQSGPILNTMSVTFASRSSCADSPNYLDDFSNVPVSWSPLYANGIKCEASGYQGDADLQYN